MPRTALSLFAVQVVVTIGLRVAVQRWLTGSSGLRLPSAGAASLEWSIVALLVLGAMLVGVVAPLLQLGGFLQPLVSLQRLGILCFGLGLAIEVCGQFWMGASWRVGVDRTERTRLITTGPFMAVRNPIFTGMVLASIGLALLTSNLIALLGLALMLTGTELQVRTVEEPYLRRVHGAAYLAYAARAGRFVPGVGRVTRVP